VWTIQTTEPGPYPKNLLEPYPGIWNIYINGVLKFTGQKIIVPYMPTPQTGHARRGYLGKAADKMNFNYLIGHLDDFRIYNGTLDLNQVIELYRGRVDVKCDIITNNNMNVYNTKNGSRGGDTIMYKYNDDSEQYNIESLAFGGTGGFRSYLHDTDTGNIPNEISDPIASDTKNKLTSGQGGITYLFNNKDIINAMKTSSFDIFNYLITNNKIICKLGYKYYYSTNYNIYFGGRGGNIETNDIDYTCSCSCEDIQSLTIDDSYS
jgi:hypothetical protein